MSISVQFGVKRQWYLILLSEREGFLVSMKLTLIKMFVLYTRHNTAEKRNYTSNLLMVAVKVYYSFKPWRLAAKASNLLFIYNLDRMFFDVYLKYDPLRYLSLARIQWTEGSLQSMYLLNFCVPPDCQYSRPSAATTVFTVTRTGCVTVRDAYCVDKDWFLYSLMVGMRLKIGGSDWTVLWLPLG